MASQTISDKTHKLTHGEQVQILNWLAEDNGYAYTAKLVKEEFGKDITRATIFYYANFYKDKIAELRKQINADMLNVPIANQIVRMRRYEAHYNLLMKQGKFPEARIVLKEAREELADTKQPIFNNNIYNVMQKELQKLDDKGLDDFIRNVTNTESK